MTTETENTGVPRHRIWPAFPRHLAVCLFVMAIVVALLPYDKSEATPQAVPARGE